MTKKFSLRNDKKGLSWKNDKKIRIPLLSICSYVEVPGRWLKITINNQIFYRSKFLENDRSVFKTDTL